MYFLLTQRLIRYNTGTKEPYEPRTANYSVWKVDGPFTRRSRAEQASVSALGTQTCTTAKVLTPGQMLHLHAESLKSSFSYDNKLTEALSSAIDLYDIRTLVQRENPELQHAH
jgi:hypothetical protein